MESVCPLANMPIELLLYMAYKLNILTAKDVLSLALCATWLRDSLLGTEHDVAQHRALLGVLPCALKGWANATRLALVRGRYEDGHLNTALEYAATYGFADVVGELLRHPLVDPTLNCNKAIRAASFHGRSAVVELLLGDARVDASDRDNDAINWAVIKGHTDVVSLLLNCPRVIAHAGIRALAEAAHRNGHNRTQAVIVARAQEAKEA